MKKNHWMALVSIAVVVLTAAVYGRVNASAQPGDAADPLVSKSYVDGQINQIKSLITAAAGSTGTGSASAGQADKDAMVAEVLAYIETVYGDSLRQSSQGNAGPVAESSAFTTVRAYKGQILIGMASTEIILRGGSAVAVTGINGLCDVTGGADVTNGAGIKLNHLLIIPSDDGRGMKFTSDAYLMVKGGYYLVD